MKILKKNILEKENFSGFFSVSVNKTKENKKSFSQWDTEVYMI